MPDFTKLMTPVPVNNTRAETFFKHQAINALLYPNENPIVKAQKPTFNPVSIDDFVSSILKAINGQDFDIKGVPLLTKDIKTSFDRLQKGEGTRDDYFSISKKLEEYKNKMEDSKGFFDELLPGTSGLLKYGSILEQGRRNKEHDKAVGLYQKLARELEQLAPPVMGKAIMDEVVGMDYYADPKDEKAKIDRFRYMFGQNKTVEPFKTADISQLQGKVWNFNDYASNKAGLSVNYKNKGDNAEFLNSLTMFSANNVSAGDQMFGLKDELKKQVEGSTVYKKFTVEKQFQAKALSDLASHFSNVLSKAETQNDKNLKASAEGALNDIQVWFKENGKYLTAPTHDRTTRTIANFATGFNDAIGSMSNVRTPSKGEMLSKYNANIRSASQPVPIDMNSDGKVDQIDVDIYGNPIMSNQFSYTKKNGSTGYNWGSIPEASARVIGQMAPILITAALTDGAGAALLPEAGVAVGSMSAVQRGATLLKNLNQWKGLRLLDRASTLATVYASTYDQMVMDELRYTSNIKEAEARGRGRALIEGLTEAIGAPEFGMLRPTRFATTMRQDIINSLVPGMTFSKGLNSIIYNGSSVLSKAFKQSMTESLEEEMSLFGNFYLTKAVRANDKAYAREDSASLENIYSTFVDSLASMAPFAIGTVGGQHLLASKSQAVKNLSNWNVANNPVLYRAKVQEMYDKGKLTKEQAATAASRINYLSNKIESIPSFSNIRDLRTLIEDKDEQQRYFNAIVNHEELSTIDHSGLSTEQISELETQIKDAASTIEKGQKRIEKYAGLSQEEKNAIVSKVFEEKKQEISETKNPSDIVRAVQLAQQQVTKLKDRMNPHDASLREDFINHAQEVLGEWVGTNTESANKFTQTLYEDMKSNQQSNASEAKFVNLYEKLGLMYQNKDFISENDFESLQTGYEVNQVQAIRNFNSKSEEEKIESLSDFIKSNDPEFFFDKSALDEVLTTSTEKAEFTQEQFQAARDKALGKRVEEKKEEEPAITQTTTLTDEEEDVEGIDDNIPKVLKEMEDTQEARNEASKRWISKIPAIKRGDRLSSEAAVNVTRKALKQAFGSSKDMNIAPDLWNKAMTLIEDYLHGRISKENFFKEATSVVHKNVSTLKGAQIKNLRTFFNFTTLLGNHTNIPKTEAVTTPTAAKEPSMTVNIESQQQELFVKMAAAVDLISPLKTAAFEVGQSNKEKTDPAIVRNAFLLKQLLTDHAGKKIKVQSRGKFLEELAQRKGLNIEDFKNLLSEAHKAYEKKESITDLANQINNFFAKDFFETEDASGTPELFYHIKTNGSTLFEEHAPIVTVVDNDGKTVDFAYEDDRYPFYANLIKAEPVARDIHSNKFPSFIKQLVEERGEEMQKYIGPQTQALEALRRKIREDKNYELIVDIRKITEGKYVPSGVKSLAEFNITPDDIVVQTTPDEMYKGFRLAGIPGQSSVMIDGEPVMMFNNKMDKSEADALAKLIANKEERERFFDNAVDFSQYLSSIVNLFQSQGRRIVFYINDKTDELIARKVDTVNGKLHYKTMTEEEVSSFLQTSFYNIRKEALYTMTKRLSMTDGNIVENKQPYIDYIKETHSIHVEKETGKPSTRKNLQLVLDPTQVTQAMSVELGKRPVDRAKPTEAMTSRSATVNPKTESSDIDQALDVQGIRKAIESNSKKVNKVEEVVDGVKKSWYEIEGRLDESGEPIRYGRVTADVDKELPFTGESNEFSTERSQRKDKKAEIERRRPTSYIRDSKDKKSSLETFRNEAKREWDGVSVITGDRMKNLYVGIQLFVEAYPEHKDLLDKFIKKENGTIGITNNNLSFVLNTLKKQGVTTESELGVKINAKYDAELKVLEEQPKSNQFEQDKKAEIEKRKEELEKKYEETKERHLRELEKAGVDLGKWGIDFNDIIHNIEEENNSDNHSKEVEVLAKKQYEEWWALNREKQEIESDANRLSFSDYNFSNKQSILDRLKKAISKVYQSNRQALDEGFAEWYNVEREVATVGGNQYAAHGMGKTSIANAFTDLINLFEKGINPFRGQGALDVATLAGGISDGTTTGGAYMDGAFTLVANRNHNGRIENINQIGGIIVNEGIATPEVLSALKELFPNLVIESTLNSKSLVEQLNAKYDTELKALEQQPTSNQFEHGNFVDDVARAIFGFEFSTAKYPKPDNWTQEAYDSLIQGIGNFSNSMRAEEYFFSSQRNYLWDDDAERAGEIDCLIFNEDGVPIGILDFKTSAHFNMQEGKVYNYKSEASQKDSYIMQQNSYATMFHKMYGIYPELIILPIRMKYESKTSELVTEVEIMYNEVGNPLVELPMDPNLAIPVLRPQEGQEPKVGLVGEVTGTPKELSKDEMEKAVTEDREDDRVSIVEPETSPTQEVEKEVVKEVKAVEEPLFKERLNSKTKKKKRFELPPETFSEEELREAEELKNNCKLD